MDQDINLINNQNLFYSNTTNNNLYSDYRTKIASMNSTILKKNFVRLSTIQPSIKTETDYNENLFQPMNNLRRQSRINMNNNIIKNITKRSSLVLNNLGIGLTFRKSIYEPNSFSPNLCPMCNKNFNQKNIMNNNINNNRNSPNPFNIGLNEDEVELVNNTIKNIHISETDEKYNNSNHKAKSQFNNLNKQLKAELNPSFQKSCIDDINNDNRFGNKLNDKNVVIDNNKTSKNSQEKEIFIPGTSLNSYTVMDKVIHSKNVSFFLNNNNEKKKIVTNNNLNFNKLKAFEKFNNQHNYKNTSDSKINNESDVSLDNLTKGKTYKLPSPVLDEKDKFFNLINNNFDSNKNVNLITNFNNTLHSQNQISKILTNNFNNNNNNINCGSKLRFPVTRKNTIVQNTEQNEYELTNIKSKRDALKQSVISYNSNNNNLKIFKDENFSELKLAKKETILYKNCFDSITTEYKKLKSHGKNFDKILSQELENYKNLKEEEILKFAKALEIYNELYSQQIRIKDVKINQLANLIDHLVENDNYSLANNLNNSKL